MQEYGNNIWGFGMIFMIIFWIVFIWFIVWLISELKIRNEKNEIPIDSKETAKMRFAKGKITKKEYKNILDVLKNE